MRILLTGGSGKLGQELQKLRRYDFVPTHEEMDIHSVDSIHAYADQFRVGAANVYGIDLIVHCAAYTDVAKAEEDRVFCWATNVIGTGHISDLQVPMLYISTEYVFDGRYGMYSEEDPANPSNYYAMTKLTGESVINKESKILRLLFKPRPWPFESAFIDQYTSGDYVDVIAKEVDKAIDLFDKLSRVTHIGTGRKTMFDLACQTRQVKGNVRSEIKGVGLPGDCSLDCSVWNRIKRENLLA